MIARLVQIAVIAVAVIGVVTFVALSLFRSPLRDRYMSDLDAWVKAGGSPATIQRDIVETCGKLVMSQSGIFQNLGFMTYDRDDFDFSVDVCTKMTVNRVHKQPEFTKPEIVSAVCGPKVEPFFQELCQRSGISVAK